MRIDLARLSCRPVIPEGAPSRVPVGVPEALRRPVPVGEVADLLYLPSALNRGNSLCVAGDVVPVEAILDPWTLAYLAGGEDAVLDLGEAPPDRSDLRVAVLGNVFSRNFCHWVEELYKVAVIEGLGLDCRYALADLPPFAPAFLAAMDVGRDRIVMPSRPVTYRAAVFTPPVSHATVGADPQALYLLRRALLGPLAGRPSPHGPRLWLDRGPSAPNGGVTINAAEVHALVRSRGFAVVDMGALPVEEQLVAAMNARMVGGPHGAQFAHVAFLPPGSEVIELFSPVHVNPFCHALCRVLGHRYQQVVARSHLIEPYPHRRDQVVDLDHLALAIDQAEGRVAPRGPASASAWAT